MPSIIPVPAGRSSDLLVQSRLLAQLQSDQSDLLRLQTQLSSGRRVIAPSDDAPAAVRGITLQRLLEQNKQLQTNVDTSNSYLNATDSALAGVGDLLSSTRAAALAALTTTTSDSERQSILNQVKQALDQLVAVGNQKFRDRYLFAGSRSTSAPFESNDQQVIYNGNETTFRSYADTGLLFDTGVSGDDVFGAIAPQVLGTADLNPILAENTKLADLRGGLGVSKGSIVVSDGASSRTIDLSSAATVGDVMRLITANPPTGRTLGVHLSQNGINVSIDGAGGGNLTIREANGGSTASDLGIVQATGVGAGTIVGTDLNPQLDLTTRLSDLFGARAVAYLQSAGANNDLIIEGRQNGATQNGVKVQYVDDDLLQNGAGLSAGNEFATFSATPVAASAALKLSGSNNDLVLTATTPGIDFNNVTIQIDSSQSLGNAATVDYDSGARVLTLHVDSASQTTLDTLVTAINGSGLFTAAPDATAGEGYNGAGLVNAADGGAVTGNTGNSGAAANTILVHIDAGHTTANQVLAALEANSTISALYQFRIDPADTAQALDAGTGVVDVNASGATSGGSGSAFDTTGLQLKSGDSTYNIDVSGAQTVEDLLNAINRSGANALATLNDTRTGINVRSRVSGVDFSIGEAGGQTAAQLGIRSLNRQTELSSLNHGRGVGTASGSDFTITRADGTSFDVDIDGALTVGDVIDLINQNAANQDPSTRVVAQLATNGNGIELVDANTAGTSTLTVTKAFLSTAAWDLGLVPQTASSATSASGVGNTQVLTGSDVNPLEVQGAFNSLLRLSRAISQNDNAEIQRAIDSLDQDLTRVTFARSEVGARGQTLDSMKTRLTNDNTELQTNLSDQIDVDFVDAVSQLSAKQATVEASLRLVSRTFQLTLLDFL